MVYHFLQNLDGDLEDPFYKEQSLKMIIGLMGKEVFNLLLQTLIDTRIPELQHNIILGFSMIYTLSQGVSLGLEKEMCPVLLKIFENCKDKFVLEEVLSLLAMFVNVTYEKFMKKLIKSKALTLMVKHYNRHKEIYLEDDQLFKKLVNICSIYVLESKMTNGNVNEFHLAIPIFTRNIKLAQCDEPDNTSLIEAILLFSKLIKSTRNLKSWETNGLVSSIYDKMSSNDPELVEAAIGFLTDYFN
jgi:hypothetical protein